MKVQLFPKSCVVPVRAFLVAGLLGFTASSATAETPTMNVGAHLGTFSVGEFQWALIANGGTGNCTWQIVSGDLPDGVALRTDVPSWFTPGASAGLMGVATTAGEYPFTIAVTCDGQYAEQATSVTITALTITDPYSLPDAFVGELYSYTLTGAGNVGEMTWTPDGALPAGLTLSAVGVLSGTPTAGGFYNINVSLNDGVDTIHRGLSLFVYGAVHITSELLPNAPRNVAYSAQIDATGGTPPYTFTVNGGGLPFGLTMDASGLITGTPNQEPRRYEFYVTVTDNAGAAHGKALTIYVVGVPPMLPSISPHGGMFDDCTIGVPCALGLYVGNGGTAPLTWSATGLPSGFSIRWGSANTSYRAPGDAEIVGVAAATGTYQVEVTVTDAVGASATNTFPLTVSPLVLRSDGTNGMVGVSFAATLRILGGTAPYAGTITAGKLPAGLTFDGGTGVVTGTPLESGGFHVDFRFADDAGHTLNTSQHFQIGGGTSTITINNYWDLGTVTTGSFYSNQLSACCATGYAWSVLSGTLPLEVTLSSGGLLSGAATTEGTYTFLVQAADVSTLGNVGVRQFTLTVTPLSININSTLPSGNVGVSYSQALTATGGTGATTWALAPFSYLPPGLALALSDGTWTLRGAPTASGQYAFSLTVTDSAGHAATRGFNVSIYPSGVTPPVTLSQGPDFGTWSIGEVEMPLVATGGNGSYTWAVIGGALPPGVSLRMPPDLAPWFSPDTSAGLIGIATDPGTYTFTLRVTSGTAYADQPCTVKVTLLRSTDQYWLPDAFVGEPYSFALSADGNAGPVAWTAQNPLPAGLTLGAARMLSGTPTTSGYYGIDFSMNDGTDTVSRRVDLSVFDIRITTAGQLPNATQNASYSTVIEAAGGTPPYSFTYSGGLPGGLTLNATTGAISGTPTGVGNSGFWLTVTDANHLSYTRMTAIDVVGAPKRLPYISPYGNTWNDCTFGVPCRLGVSVFSGGTAPFTWSATGLPAGFSIDTATGASNTWMTPGDGEIVGVATEIGTFNVQVTVTDAEGVQATNAFLLRISPLMARDFDGTGTRGTAFEAFNPSNPYPFPEHYRRIRVIGGQYTGFPSYTSAIVAGQLPAGLSLDATTQVVSGTPLENGSFNITLNVTDSADPANTLRTSQGFQIGGGTTTINVNQSDLGLATIGQSFSYQLSACCIPNPPGYVWSLETGAALPGGLTLSSAGLISGTPAGSPGPVTFLVSATDSINPANYGVRLLTLRLTSLTITTNSSLSFRNVGTSYSQTLTATGGSGALTWTLAPGSYLPPGLGLSTGGVLGGTPTKTGQFSFTVQVADTAGSLATRTFNISIYVAGEAPPVSLSIGTAYTSQIGVFTTQLAQTSASGGIGPYTFSLTPDSDLPVGAAQIPGMRVQNGPPFPTNFSTSTTAGYMGVIAEPGVYHPSIRVTDSSGTRHFDQVLTITVPSLAILSSTSPPKATKNAYYSFTLEPYGGSGNYSWSIVSGALPAGLLLNATTGTISGTPTASGTFSPNIRITDLGTSAGVNTGFTFVVDPFAIATNGMLPQGTMNVSYATNLSAPGCVGSPCTWSMAGGGLPGGLSLNSTTGVISGAPTNLYAGSFTIQVSGTNGSVQKVFSLSILGAAFPLVTIPSNVVVSDVTVGQVTSAALLAQGGTPPYSWTLESGGLPPGLSLVGFAENYSSLYGPGLYYLRGRAMEAGAYTFALRVTDHVGATATKAFTWNVSRLSFQYTNLPIGGTTLKYSQAYTQPLLVLGGTGNYPAWSTPAAMPPGLTLNAATGIVTGTPANTGTFTIPIQVTDDASNTIVSNVTFTIGSGTAATIGFGLGASLSTIQLGQSSSFNLNPSGGTGPYTITALTALPPGFGLEFGNSLLSGQTGYFIAAMPLAAGTFSFTIQAQDTLGNIGVRTFTVTVAPFTLFSSTTLNDGSVGVPYSQSIVAWDNVGAVIWSVASGSTLPSGLSLSSAGVISGTPTQTGSFGFTLSATDPSTAVRNYTFTLRVSNITITDPAILPIATVGVPYTYTFTGVGGASRTWSATSLPNGLTMSAAGTITGTPIWAATNAWWVTVTVTDGVVRFSKPFSLFVVNATPTLLDYSLTSAALTDVSVGQSVSVTLSPFNGVPPYTWSVAGGSALPPGLNLISGSALPSNFNPSSTLLAGAPIAAGQYTFDLIATDTAGTQVRRTFTLTVSSIAILSGSPRTATVGTAYAEQFTAVGGTPPYAFSLTPTSLIGDTLPPGFTFSSNGMISGTTTSTGNYSFRLRVQDAAGNSFSRTYTLTVTNAFGLSVTNTNGYAPVGIGEDFKLLTNGSSTYSWSVVAGSLPPGRPLVSESGNTWWLRGVAAAPGTYTFTLRATDTANASNTADHAFTFKVSPMQAVSPTGFIDDLPSGQVGAAYSATIKVAGGTPPYTFTASPFAPLPPGLTLSSAGVLSGTPTAIGRFTIAPIVTDAAAQTLYVGRPESLHVVVTPAGTAAPLEFEPNAELPDASAGAPYVMPLQFWVGGGAPPLAFSVAPGSSLPAGLALMLGTNGVPAMIGGTPSTAGTYSFSLIATDSVNQTVTVPFSLNVSTLALNPPLVSLPVGVVGTSYSVPLVASGGTAPYTIQFDIKDTNVPPGLTIDGSGNLSGTPTYPGIFGVIFTVADSAGASLPAVRLITIDNAIGEAPAVSLAPNPIQLSYALGAAAPAPVAVSVSTSTGTSPFTLALSGIPGATLSASSGTTPGTVKLNLNVASLTAGTFTGLLGVSAPQAVNRFDGVPVTLTVCEFTVFPLAGSAPDTGGAGTFNVSSGARCAWTAVASDPSWITITDGGSGLGSGAVSYSLARNESADARTGTISVNGAVYTVTQFGSACTYTVNPSAGSVPNTGGTGNFTVSTNGACGWTAVASDPWLTVTGGASGTGNATVSYSAAPNATPDARSATITVNGAMYAVTQFGTDCSFAISPAGVTATAAGGTATVSVTASSAMCGWTASSVNLGVSPASGSGSGTLQIAVPANLLPASRWLAATIAGETFSVYQTGSNCTVTLGSSSALAPAGASAGSVEVLTGPGCTYDTVLGPSWLTVTSGGSGVGPGTLVYWVEPNSTTFSRTGTLSVGGQVFQVTQEPLACSVTLNTTGLGSPFGSSAGNGTIAVTANGPNCSWTASSNVPWASVMPGSGAGNSTLTVSVLSNAGSTVQRFGELAIAGQTVNLSQASTACTFELESSSGSASASGGSASVRVIAPGVCGWSASSNAEWLTITSSGSAGTSAVQFSAAQNLSATPRSGTLTIAGLAYTVDQAGAACAFSVTGSPTSPLLSSDGASGQSFQFSALTGCSPAAVSYSNWITVDATTFSGTSGNVTYSAAANPYGTTRSGTIQVGNALFTVVQSGATCAYSLNAYGKVFRVAGGSDTLLGSPTAVGCTPAYGTDQPSFITLGPLTGPVLNLFSLPYEVSPFTTPLTAVVRLGRITFGGQILTIKQLSW